MARLRKSHHTVLPRCSSPEADSMDDDLQDHVHYSQDTPNDLSDGDNLLQDDNFDKALIDFYMKHKLKSLKRKITSSKMNKEYANKYHQAKRTRQEKSYATISTRYSSTYFSSVLSKLTPRQKEVITKYGMGCLLKFVKTDVPLRFVKWIAGKFDTRASEIQVGRKFIPVTKQTMPDCEAGGNFLLSHFNLTSIPTVNFFANKLCSEEQLSDEDIFICFMAVAFTCFLCPNSSSS